MNGKRFFGTTVAVIVTLAFLAGLAQAEAPAPAPMGTAFIYQGRLKSGDSAYNGACDFKYTLWNDSSGGSQVGTVQTLTSVAVTDGYFTVVLDFGSGRFNGDARWLDISVRCPAGSATYTQLTPRQPLTPAPYALWAAGAPWSGLSGVPAGFADGVDNDTTYSAGTGLALSGSSFSVATGYRLPQSCSGGQIAKWNGSAWICAADDTGGGGAGWSLTGNAGTTPGTNYLGTSDNKALELKVNGQRVLRLEPNAGGPNLIGGYSGNTLSAGLSSVTIAGGGEGGGLQNRVTGQRGTVGGGADNLAGRSGTVGGGFGNEAGEEAAVAGGLGNNATGLYSAVAGGNTNTASGVGAAVGGGWSNEASGFRAAVGGGTDNTASGQEAIVGGGASNAAGGQQATVAGGSSNIAPGLCTTVGGGAGNSATADAATVAGGSTNLASGTESTIAGGWGNKATSFLGTVGGGDHNTVSGKAATIGGGSSNTASGEDATVGGGIGNQAGGPRATVGGGYYSQAGGNAATVPGGANNSAGGAYSLAAGAAANASHVGAFVWSSATATDSWGDRTFTARSHGGARFYTAAGTATGVQLAAGGTSWGSISDRAAKENFSAVDTTQLLEVLAGLPVQSWKLKAQPAEMRHVGPVAQEFNGRFTYLFGEVENPVYINTMDAVGVSLAAVQGLYERSWQQSARIEALEAENAALRAENVSQQAQLDDLAARLAALEAQVTGEEAAP